MAGNIGLRDNDILLRGVAGLDKNHGLGWYGNTGGMVKLWNGIAIDGPILYGYNGGMLGTNFGGTKSNVLCWTSSTVGIGTTTVYNKLDVAGNIGIRDNDILLRGVSGPDNNHGLGWYGAGKPWNGIAIDGPVLYGFLGGMLGTN